MWTPLSPSGSKLYVAKIDHVSCKVKLRSLAIITSGPLPIGDTLHIPLFDTNNSTVANVTRYKRKLRFTHHQLAQGVLYTRRLLRAILNRPLEIKDGLLPYIILPLGAESEQKTTSKRLRHTEIAWTEVESAMGELHRPFNLDDLTRDTHDAMTTTTTELSGHWYILCCEGQGDDASLTLAATTTRAHLSALAPLKAPAVSQRSAKSCFRYTIPASVYRSALFLPSILTVLDDHQTAFDLNLKRFSGQADTLGLCQALTLPSAQRSRDYQRLEFLGDVVLKVLASSAVFVDGPTRKESELNAARRAIVNNAALAETSTRSGLYDFMITTSLRIKDYVPIGFQLDGSKQTPKDVIAPKERLADVVEAVVGVASRDGSDVEAAYAAAVELGIALPIASWAVLKKSAVGNAASNQDLAEGTALGYDFNHRGLLRTALSMEDRASRDRQRLQFLGDAVLDYFVATILYCRHPTASEGDLSQLKEFAVNNETLSAFCVHEGLHARLHSIAQENLRAPLKAYARAVQAARAGPATPYWQEISGSKALADTVEAVLGAAFVDAGFDFTPLQVVFDSKLLPFLDQHVFSYKEKEPARKRRKL